MSLTLKLMALCAVVAVSLTVSAPQSQAAASNPNQAVQITATDSTDEQKLCLTCKNMVWANDNVMFEVQNPTSQNLWFVSKDINRGVRVMVPANGSRVFSYPYQLISGGTGWVAYHFEQASGSASSSMSSKSSTAYSAMGEQLSQLIASQKVTYSTETVSQPVYKPMARENKMVRGYW